MKRHIIALILVFLSGHLIAEQRNVSGLFITNDQGAEYENTIFECKTGKTIKLSGKQEFEKFVELYFSLKNLNEYGELYVDLLISDYEVIDKTIYTHSHYDAKAVFEYVVKHSVDQKHINECRKDS